MIRKNNNMRTLNPKRIIDYIRSRGHARAHDLQRSLGISKVAIHQHLRKLTDAGKIKRTGSAPFVLYTLPGKKAGNLIALEKMKKKMIPILRHAKITKAALFGSYARGDNMPKSDVDILVDLPEQATLLDLIGLQQELEEKLKKKVDVVEYAGIHPLLKQDILRYQYPLV